MSNSNNLLLKSIKYLFFLILGSGLLILAFKNQDPVQLLNELIKVDFSWVIVSIILGALAIVSRALRWLTLLESLGYSSSKANSIYAVAIGYFSNIPIPRAGEITRCASLNQTEDIPINKLFGTIILERIIDVIMLIGLMGVTCLVNFNNIFAFFSSIESSNNGTFSILIIWLLGIIFLVVALIIIFNKSLKKLSFYKKLYSFLVGLKDGIKSISNVKNKLVFWSHTLFIWTMYWLMTYVCFFCIPETSHLSLGDGLFIMVIGGIGMVIPTPGGFGSYHLIVQYGLILLGISNIPSENLNTDPTLLFATTVHSAQTLMVLIFGAVSLFLLFIQKKKKNVIS